MCGLHGMDAHTACIRVLHILYLCMYEGSICALCSCYVCQGSTCIVYGICLCVCLCCVCQGSIYVFLVSISTCLGLHTHQPTLVDIHTAPVSRQTDPSTGCDQTTSIFNNSLGPEEPDRATTSVLTCQSKPPALSPGMKSHIQGPLL